LEIGDRWNCNFNHCCVKPMTLMNLPAEQHLFIDALEAHFRKLGYLTNIGFGISISVKTKPSADDFVQIIVREKDESIVDVIHEHNASTHWIRKSTISVDLQEPDSFSTIDKFIIENVSDDSRSSSK